MQPFFRTLLNRAVSSIKSMGFTTLFLQTISRNALAVSATQRFV
jgi:hypothetical protein